MLLFLQLKRKKGFKYNALQTIMIFFPECCRDVFEGSGPTKHCPTSSVKKPIGIVLLFDICMSKV